MKQKIVIQSRLSSSRLPGKALLSIDGKTLLERVIDSAIQSLPDEIILVTTQENEDLLLVNIAERKGLTVLRGSTNDVRSRFLSVCHEDPNSLIIRFTADNPLHSPKLLRELVSHYKQLVNNNSQPACLGYHPNTIIEGTGSEIFQADSLIKYSKEDDSDFCKEHVTPILYQNGGTRINSSKASKIFSKLSFTIDYLQDYVNLCLATTGLWDRQCDEIIDAVVSSSSRYKLLERRNHE